MNEPSAKRKPGRPRLTDEVLAARAAATVAMRKPIRTDEALATPDAAADAKPKRAASPNRRAARRAGRRQSGLSNPILAREQISSCRQ